MTAFLQIALAGRSAGPALPPIDIFPRRLSGNFPVSGSRHRNGRSRKAKVRLWLSFLSMPDSRPRRRDSVAPPDHAKKAPSGKASFPDDAFFDPFLVLLGASNKLFQDISESAKGKRIRLDRLPLRGLAFPGKRHYSSPAPALSSLNGRIGLAPQAPAPVSGQLSNRPG